MKEYKQFDVGQKVYLTRYALTTGIESYAIESACNTSGWWRLAKSGNVWSERELFATLDAAQQKAKEMATRALKALAKKRARLEHVARAGAKVNQ